MPRQTAATLRRAILSERTTSRDAGWHGSAIYIELYFIFSSVWGHKLYTLYGLLALVGPRSRSARIRAAFAFVQRGSRALESYRPPLAPLALLYSSRSVVLVPSRYDARPPCCWFLGERLGELFLERRAWCFW